jgi:hypothetical protein
VKPPLVNQILHRGNELHENRIVPQVLWLERMTDGREKFGMPFFDLEIRIQ